MTPGALLEWLRDVALPLWAKHGVDRTHGGFFELLGHDLVPIERPRRARLTARQIYCFSVARKIEWDGPAQEIVNHGLDFLTKYLIRQDGSVVSSVALSGAVEDAGHDLYDVAFVLFALASVIDTFGPRPELEVIGRRIAEFTQKPYGGYDGASREEGTLLLTNPHMHLAEAFLAWVEASPDIDGYWHDQAARLIELARRQMVMRNIGALPEVFGADWSPLPDGRGLRIEPGHQFEWAWLLARWAELDNSPGAFEDAMLIAGTGEAHGVAPESGIVINELDDRLAPRDRASKLWPQAERAKFWHAVVHHPHAGADLKACAVNRREEALSALGRFLTDARPGLWREAMLPDGRFVIEPVRASSLYHITCAAFTVNRPQLL